MERSHVREGVTVTAPRCDVAPWLLPREREPDDREESGMCDVDDDTTGDDDYSGDYAGRHDDG